MYYVGTCPFCEQGNLGIRICSKESDVVILCDECDAVWLSTNLESKPLFPEQPLLPCPFCQGNLSEHPAHWANFEEIYMNDWIHSIKGETDEF